MVSISQLEDLVGTEFPHGSFTIEPYEHWLCVNAVMSPPLPEGVAHPMYAYFAAIRGMGKTLDEVFADAESSAADGPMFGEAGLEFHGGLEVGATYTVRGRYTSALRKKGKRAGVFDIVGFELEIVDEAGAVVAVSSNSIVYPRRETAV